MSLWRRLLALFEPPQFCKTCGRELSIDAVAIYDTRTGKPKRLRWAVACSQSGMSFKGETHWSGNGAVHEHTHAMDLSGPPSWVPAWLAARIAGEADDFGYLSDRSVIDRIEALSEKERP